MLPPDPVQPARGVAAAVLAEAEAREGARARKEPFAGSLLLALARRGRIASGLMMPRVTVLLPAVGHRRRVVVAAAARAQEKGGGRTPSPGGQDKNRPCWKFQTKECPYSSTDCRWAHRRATAEELAARPPQRSRTQTPGPAGSKPVCFEWREKKTCARGDKCRFEHEGVGRVASPATSRRPRKRRSRSARAAAAEAAAAAP
jgi:hypothetical protein